VILVLKDKLGRERFPISSGRDSHGMSPVNTSMAVALAVGLSVGLSGVPIEPYVDSTNSTSFTQWST